jgi:hypothetical protein
MRSCRYMYKRYVMRNIPATAAISYIVLLLVGGLGYSTSDVDLCEVCSCVRRAR